MKFDKRELHFIKIALIRRCYELDELITQSKEDVTRNFLIKEREENLLLLKKIG